MKQITYPQNFDGSKFSKKFGVETGDFYISGTLLNYDEMKVGKTLTPTDLEDCVVDLERLQRIRDRENSAYAKAKNIPNWALWSEQEALDWLERNLSDSEIEGIENLADARTILKLMRNVLRGLARMEIAMRDKLWPDLPESE